jgi:hypothetical protein
MIRSKDQSVILMGRVHSRKNRIAFAGHVDCDDSLQDDRRRDRAIRLAVRRVCAALVLQNVSARLGEQCRPAAGAYARLSVTP